jgi:DNA-binding NarL/FixJ family response regulator
VIILTTFDLDDLVYAAPAAGAGGFLLKDVTPEHLVRSGDALLAPLTPRELEVLRPPAQGLSNTEPAAHLDLAWSRSAPWRGARRTDEFRPPTPGSFLQ